MNEGDTLLIVDVDEGMVDRTASMLNQYGAIDVGARSRTGAEQAIPAASKSRTFTNGEQTTLPGAVTEQATLPVTVADQVTVPVIQEELEGGRGRAAALDRYRRPPRSTPACYTRRRGRERKMSFGRNPHIPKAQAAEPKARDAGDDGARERAWREAAHLWERAAEREMDGKRRDEYSRNAERARALADGKEESTDKEEAGGPPDPKTLN